VIKDEDLCSRRDEFRSPYKHMSPDVDELCIAVSKPLGVCEASNKASTGIPGHGTRYRRSAIIVCPSVPVHPEVRSLVLPFANDVTKKFKQIQFVS